jgi:predicted N-formylglutamate amidohydrolase
VKERAARIDAWLVTCEHGGNRVPAPLRPLFRGHRALLATHRGFDPGARALAGDLAVAFDAPVVTSTVSRLVVDLNRSIGHPQLFSPVTRALPRDVRATIVARHYEPYRQEVERRVAQAVALGRRVIHVSSHSFTPVLGGQVRRADVGLLYDPSRRGEVALCARWKAALAMRDPALRVRRNYPYAGKGDGLTAYLRRRFPPEAYVGIELEVNQRIVLAAGRRWAALRGTLVDSLRMASRSPTPLHAT